MSQRMLSSTPKSFRFPVVLSLAMMSLLGLIDTARAQDSLTVSPSSYTFSATVGGAVQTTTIQVGSTAASLNYTTSFFSAQNWLSASTSQTVTPGTINVYATPGNLPVGTYSGTVTVTPSGASTTPVVSPYPVPQMASTSLKPWRMAIPTFQPGLQSPRRSVQPAPPSP